ncbi:CG11885 [Drosophila busckii]|uniref:CG11885 n=1 Tax=Drosophila busckii TaxID=30019 RepID=A0A0M4EPK0_DROBS|nr:uncharacterized protein LOC108598713 [Drosophila busckii]ALC38520.1 CG11885 [Drosophila busckii]
MCEFVTKDDVGFNKQFVADICGIKTEFVYHNFANKWMLFITQLGKLPALYNVAFDVKRDERVIPYLHGPIDNPEQHVSVPVTMNCCLGRDTDEMRGAIQFLVNKTGLSKCPKEVMIALGLKQLERDELQAVAKVLQEMIF